MMRWCILASAVGFLACCSPGLKGLPAASGASVALDRLSVLSNYRQLVLGNGLTVQLVEAPGLGRIDIDLTLLSGAIDDEGLPGLARLTVESLVLGAEDLKRDALLTRLATMEGSIATDASLETTSVDLSLAKGHLSAGLDLLAAMVQRPAFNHHAIEDYKQRYLAGLIRESSANHDVMGSYFRRLLFGAHPYGASPSGNATSIGRIGPAELRGFHTAWYRPHLVVITLVGDFDGEEAKALLSRKFGRWYPVGEPGLRPPSSLVLPPSEPRVLLVNRDDAMVASVQVGGFGIAHDSSERPALTVVNALLGDDQDGWLNRELRDNSGLVAYARSHLLSLRGGGSFWLEFDAGAGLVTQTIDRALETYRRLWEQGIGVSELARAKKAAKRQIPDPKRIGALAHFLGVQHAYGETAHDLVAHNGVINELTPDVADRLVVDYLPQANLQFVVVGRADALRDSLKKYGRIVEVDINDVAMEF